MSGFRCHCPSFHQSLNEPMAAAFSIEGAGFLRGSTGVSADLDSFQCEDSINLELLKNPRFAFASRDPVQYREAHIEES